MPRNRYVLEHIRTHDYTLSHTGKRNELLLQSMFKCIPSRVLHREIVLSSHLDPLSGIPAIHAELLFRAVMSVLTASIAIPIHFNLIPDGVFLFAIHIFLSNPAAQAESGTDRPPRCNLHTDGFPHWGPC